MFSLIYKPKGDIYSLLQTSQLYGNLSLLRLEPSVTLTPGRGDGGNSEAKICIGGGLPSPHILREGSSPAWAETRLRLGDRVALQPQAKADGA
jgi:hypothetical protein